MRKNGANRENSMISSVDKTLLTKQKAMYEKEWNDAWNANEKPVYYKCRMLNGGWCYKYYKQSVANLILERGMYQEMICLENK